MKFGAKNRPNYLTIGQKCIKFPWNVSETFLFLSNFFCEGYRFLIKWFFIKKHRYKKGMLLTAWQLRDTAVLSNSKRFVPFMWCPLPLQLAISPLLRQCDLIIEWRDLIFVGSVGFSRVCLQIDSIHNGQQQQTTTDDCMYGLEVYIRGDHDLRMRV